jgi:hypothetical protein
MSAPGAASQATPGCRRPCPCVHVLADPQHFAVAHLIYEADVVDVRPAIGKRGRKPVLNHHDIALGHDRPELVAGVCEEPGEVVCHERHDGVTIEVVRPARRVGVPGSAESQRDLCRLVVESRQHSLSDLAGTAGGTGPKAAALRNVGRAGLRRHVSGGGGRA